MSSVADFIDRRVGASARTMPFSFGGRSGFPVDLFSLGDEGAHRLVDVLVEEDPAVANLAQGGDRGLIVALDQPRGSRGELSGPLRRQDHQGEMVVHTFQTIFDRNSCHLASLASLGVFPRTGDCWGFRSRHGAEAAVTSGARQANPH